MPFHLAVALFPPLGFGGGTKSQPYYMEIFAYEILYGSQGM